MTLEVSKSHLFTQRRVTSPERGSVLLTVTQRVQLSPQHPDSWATLPGPRRLPSLPTDHPPSSPGQNDFVESGPEKRTCCCFRIQGEQAFPLLTYSPLHTTEAPRSGYLGQRHKLFIFGCAGVTHQEADREATTSSHLTAMINELDPLCNRARELLRKMSLGWPREKNQLLAANLVGSYC